jgi:Xaa-Pro aminopeptidase
MVKPVLPDSEFQQRWRRVQERIRARGLDLLVAHSNEADFANVRYLSEYWPIFETAGVVVPAQGEPALIIGPESQTYAEDRSRIKKIYKVVAYRESAEPEYPGVRVDTFASIFAEMLKGKAPEKIGLAGYQIFPLPVYEEIRAAAPGAAITKSDDVITEERIIKSPLEMVMLKEAFRISEIALDKALAEIRPGMTELQLVGIIQDAMYANGAEYEGHPTYVLAGKHSNHAIGRPGHQRLEKGKLIQLNIGARYGGYSSSIGCPVCLGKMDSETRRVVQAGLDLHFKTREWMRAGVLAREIVQKFFEYAEKIGVRQYALYGPCHGLGMMEVEQPWMEMHSNYRLRENMTFQVDTFLYTPEFGLRWETGVAVKEDGVEPFSDKIQGLIEL